MSSPSDETNPAMVVKCGRLSPDRAMKVTCSRQARSMLRLLTMPCEGEQDNLQEHGGRISGCTRYAFRTIA